MSSDSSESLSDSSEDSSEVVERKKSKKKKKSKKDDKKKSSKSKDDKKKKKAAAPPAVVKSAASDLEDGVTDKMARNPDGSVWKNPLKYWTNKPKQGVNEVGAKIILRPTKGSDVFCRAGDSITDSANFYWFKFEGDFNVLVKIKGDMNAPYDKAGIMIRQDERNWVLSGLEYYGGRMCLSTCITRGVTDWSLAPLADQKQASEEGIWIAVKRQENRIACFYSHDLKEWIQTRMGEFEAADTLKVGIAAACPTGEPYKVVFERFGIQGQE
jgi:regulation of enolase protein 1 (concanavalin A-like superfamily)